MAIQRKIVFILYALLVSFSVIGSGNKGVAAIESAKVSTVTQSDEGPFNSESIETMQSLLSSLLKVNEHTSELKNSKENKREFFRRSLLSSPENHTVYFNSYSSLQLNSANCSRFYIVYRQLLI